jgi:hypothetical protein
MAFCVFGQAAVNLIFFKNVLKLFVKMCLAISFARVQISYFSDLWIKSYGCLKFLGEVWVAKKLFIF